MPVNLGQLLAPQGAPQLPTPQRTGTDVTGAPVQSRIDQLMNNPMGMAFLLNMATGLLGQQGVAEAAGTGLAGMGRFAGKELELQTAQEQERYQREQAELAARRRGGGGGGGGGGSSGSQPSSNVDSPEFRKRVDEMFKLLVDAAKANDQEYDVIDLRGQATMMVLSEMGDSRGMDMYQELGSVSPESQRELSRRFGLNAKEGLQIFENFKAQSNEAANAVRPPTEPGMPQSPGPASVAQPPTMPSLPQIRTPEEPTIPGGINMGSGSSALDVGPSNVDNRRADYLQLLQAGQPESMARAISGYRGP